MSIAQLLKYTIEPSSLYYTRESKNPSIGSLIIGVSNTSEEDILINAFQVEIPVSADLYDANALTAEAATINPIAADDAWTFKKRGETYRAAPKDTGTTVKAGQSLTFYLRNIIINNAAGTVQIIVTESSGDGDNVSKPYVIIKTKSDLEIKSFNANPADIKPGDPSILTWSTIGAARVTLSPGEFPGIQPQGSVTVNPTVTTTYTLTAFGEGPSISSLANININPPGITFSASAGIVNVGDTITLTWVVTNARKVYISAFPGRVFELSGQEQVQVQKETNYVLRAVNIEGEKETYELTVTVKINPPKITSFTKTNGYGSVELQWETESAFSGRIETIDPGQEGLQGLAYIIPREQLAKGSYPVMVSPKTEKTFVLSVANELDTKTFNLHIPVVPQGWKNFAEGKTPDYDQTRATGFTLKLKNKLIFIIPGKSKKVYDSTNGINWNEHILNANWKDRYTDSCWIEFKNKLWMMAGESYDDVKVCNDVWSSENGIDWVCETEAAPWKPRHSASCFVLPGMDKLFIAGGFDRLGSDPEGICFNDVWSSADGKTWEQETSAAFSKGRFFSKTAVFDNKAWIIGGFTGHPMEGGLTKEVWSSADGKTWQLAKPQSGWTEKMYSQAVALSDGIYMIAVDINFLIMKPVYTLNKMNREGIYSVLPAPTWNEIYFFDCTAYNDCLWFTNMMKYDFSQIRDIVVYVP